MRTLRAPLVAAPLAVVTVALLALAGITYAEQPRRAPRTATSPSSPCPLCEVDQNLHRRLVVEGLVVAVVLLLLAGVA